MLLTFLGERDPHFPWDKFPLGQQSVQTQKNKQNRQKVRWSPCPQKIYAPSLHTLLVKVAHARDPKATSAFPSYSRHMQAMQCQSDKFCGPPPPPSPPPPHVQARVEQRNVALLFAGVRQHMLLGIEPVLYVSPAAVLQLFRVQTTKRTTTKMVDNSDGATQDFSEPRTSTPHISFAFFSHSFCLAASSLVFWQ